MLGFRWVATHAGDPASGRFKAATDSIRSQSGEVELQSVPKDPDMVVAPSDSLREAVADWLKRRKDDGPVVVMAHGYDYDPQKIYDPDSQDDAYNRVFANPSVSQRAQQESWLPIVGETDDQGGTPFDKAVAFCWTSSGSIGNFGSAGWSNSYQYAVFDLAIQAARSLALIVTALQEAGATVDVLAHSLGTRLALQTLGLLAGQDALEKVRRVVLLGGAEFSVDARDMSVGGAYEVFNLVNRSDEVLTWGAEKMTDPYRIAETGPSRVIGRFGMARTDRWVDIQLDRRAADRREDFDRWFAENFGTKLSPDGAGGRGRHWGYYMQPANRAFLKRLFADEELTVAGLRDGGLIDGVAWAGYGDLTDPVPPTPLSTEARVRAREKPRES